MSRTQLIAVVIEWDGMYDPGPELIVALSIEEATRLLVEALEDRDNELWGGLQFHDGTPKGWHLANPRPPARGSSLSDLEAYLDLYHEWANAPVWTMYRVWSNRTDPDVYHVASWVEAGWPASAATTRGYDDHNQLVRVQVEPAGPFVAIGELTVAVDNSPTTCDRCGRVHKPTDCEHGDEL